MICGAWRAKDKALQWPFTSRLDDVTDENRLYRILFSSPIARSPHRDRKVDSTPDGLLEGIAKFPAKSLPIASVLQKMSVSTGLPLTSGESTKFPANSLLPLRIYEFWVDFDEFVSTTRKFPAIFAVAREFLKCFDPFVWQSRGGG